MEGRCLDSFRKTANVRSFNDNVGECVHQYNDMVREFHLHLSYSKLQNSATNTAHLHTLFARMFEKIYRVWDQTYGCANQYRCSIA